MKYLKSLALGAIVVGTFFSCQNEEVTSENVTTTEQESVIKKDVLLALQKLHFNPGYVTPETQYDLEGNKQVGYLVEGDIFLTENQIFEMLENDKGALADAQSGKKQYRTRNLVAPNSVIRVMGYTGPRVGDPDGGSADGLTSNMQEGFRRTIANYQNIGGGFNLRFEGFFSSNAGDSQNADIVVFSKPASGAGGSAGFPSNGRPNRFVRINSPTERSNADINETVITHEIGHSIGFRHTDFFSRESCGQNVNEGQAGVGAIQIPGTPSGFDRTSIMISCFNGGSTGEFNQNDITALRSMY